MKYCVGTKLLDRQNGGRGEIISVTEDGYYCKWSDPDSMDNRVLSFRDPEMTLENEHSIKQYVLPASFLLEAVKEC